MEGRQHIGLRSGQAEGDGLTGQLQADQVAQALPVMRKIGSNGALDMKILLLNMQAEARKQLQAPGRFGVQAQLKVAFPFHRAGGGVVDEAENLG